MECVGFVVVKSLPDPRQKAQPNPKLRTRSTRMQEEGRHGILLNALSSMNNGGFPSGLDNSGQIHGYSDPQLTRSSFGRRIEHSKSIFRMEKEVEAGRWPNASSCYRIVGAGAARRQRFVYNCGYRTGTARHGPSCYRIVPRFGQFSVSVARDLIQEPLVSIN